MQCDRNVFFPAIELRSRLQATDNLKQTLLQVTTHSFPDSNVGSELVNLLLDYGANLKVVNQEGRYPL
jgi:hypothetical protein